MKKTDVRKIVLLLLLLAAAYVLARSAWSPERSTAPGGPAGVRSGHVRLYWFIPDGLRADPSVFNLYEWARQGLLPNIRKMMESGSYGYSMPVFPGHTPTNFATLLTGSTPRVHGVADGPMHIAGYPLKMVSEGGFSSTSKLVPPIWYTLEQQGYQVAVVSVPGSTPPELDAGLTIKGRWGGWGPDFPGVNFHTGQDRNLRVYQGLGNRLFNFGSELTRFLDTVDPSGWKLDLPASFSPPREARLENWDQVLYAYIYDSVDDGRERYDRVLFSRDKAEVSAHLGEGQWSDWLPVRLTWETKNDYNINTPKRMTWERELSSVALDTQARIRVIKLGPRDFFRIRILYNGLNSYVSRPSYYAEDFISAAGPMVDFVDNYPPQLIYYDEDKEVFLEEMKMSLDWHRDILGYLFDQSGSDVVIHDTYTPNQMLTSRWWMGYLDPRSRHYQEVSESIRSALWSEVLSMYKGIDDIIGEALKRAGEDTYVVLSSDHGIVPLDREVRLNNLFAREGLLNFTFNGATGEYEIDWARTRAVFLKMDGIYINPAGLDGNYQRASGKEYLDLRARIIRLLEGLRDDDGQSPVSRIVAWEEAGSLGLPEDRVGDLIIANRAGYGWIEDISPDLEVFKDSLKSGYKQAVVPETDEGMLTPFLIVGPGIRKGHRMETIVRHIDQYPTIMTLLNARIPDFVEGRPIGDIFEAR
ncbi:MAG: alkaline phosphatase family protein [bacterium]|nr:MAG: alkaline phosphatase family protein [bacterium]